MSRGLTDPTFGQEVDEQAADEAVNADPVGWIKRSFYIPETRGPMPLYPAQEAPLRQALSRDENGDFLYSTVCWSAIKKSAKSSIAASVGLWFAFRQWHSSIKVIANDLKQAESRVYYYMRRALELNDVYGGPLAGRFKITNYRITLDNGSRIEAIPIDPKGEAGGNDDMLIYSEIWGWKNRAALQMWTEATLSPLKFGQSMRWAETYAGSIGESPVLEGLYESGVREGVQPDQTWRDYEMYHTPALRQFTLWTTGQNMLPWQTDGYYAQERAALSETEFDRVHRNQWTTYTGRVFPDFNAENVTLEADYHVDKGDVFWGADDGYAAGKGPTTESYHPRAFVLAQENALGGLDVFAEYEEAGVPDHKTSITDTLAYGYPKPTAAYCDSASPMLIDILFYAYDIYAVPSTHKVWDGVKNLRRLIKDGNDVRQIRIHPRCKRLIYCLEMLRFKETGTAKGGEMNILKVDDHLPDALRYLAWPKRTVE